MAVSDFLKKEKVIISVKEARKILGNRFDCFADNEIIKLINELDNLSIIFIKLNKFKNGP